MRSQKDARKAMLGVGLARANPTQNQELACANAPMLDSPPPSSNRVIAGAVGAISRSLDQFQNQMKEVQDLVAAGNVVIEIDTDLVDGSIVRDRLEIDSVQQAELIESIRLSGQQVPILVRINPNALGRYQIAYGHRRVAACRALGRKVLGVVKSLSDRDLLVAQGQENNARSDLSFIERATYALKLEEHGLDRGSIMAALSCDKADASKLISVARAVPPELVAAIGPARKAGRPRWLGLVEMLSGETAQAVLAPVLKDPAFLQAVSDERFNRIFESLHAKPKRGGSWDVWRANDGREVVRIARSERVVNLEINQKLAPDFGEFVVARLPELFQAFAAKRPAG